MELEDENGRVLEAALAFLDDWAVVDTSSELSSRSSGAERTSPTSRAILEAEKSRKKPKRRSTDGRRKDEIQLLRAELEDLMEKADSLKLSKDLQKRAGLQAVDVSSRMSPEREETLNWVWKEVALRQKRMRTASEAENAKLNSAVEENRNIVALITELLRHHAREKQRVRAPPMGAHAFSKMTRSANEHRLLDKICRQIEASYYSTANGDLAVVCGEQKLLPGMQIVEISPTKVVAVVHYTSTIPFDLLEVSSTAPDAVNECCSASYKFVTKVNDTQVISYIVNYQLHGVSYRLCASSALRQRFSAGQVGFMIAGVSHPFSIGSASASDIKFSNRGVIRFSHLPTSPDDSDLCQVDIAMQVEIDARNDLKLQARDLDKAIIESYRKYFDNIVRKVESTLIHRQLLTSCY